MDGVRDELVSQFMFDMTKIRLSFRVFFDAIRVHAWLVSAILHKVDEVDLCLFAGELFILPHMVFISKSLTVLKIGMNSGPSALSMHFTSMPQKHCVYLLSLFQALN